MELEGVYLGTDLKYKLEITSPGFSMADDDFDVYLRRGSQIVHIPKNEAIQDGDDWYICFNSEALGRGMVKAIIVAHVPDTDFEDGIRDEVMVIDNFLNLMSI